MPKFIGNKIGGATHLDPNFTPKSAEWVCLNYAQACLAKRNGVEIYASLNTTDRGSKGSFAKRWNNWWVRTDDLAGTWVTPAMMGRAARTTIKKDLTTSC